MDEKQILAEQNAIDSDKRHIPLYTHILICIISVMASAFSAGEAMSVISLVLNGISAGLLAYSVYDCKFYISLIALPGAAILAYIFYSTPIACVGALTFAVIFAAIIAGRKFALSRSVVTALGAVLIAVVTAVFMALTVYSTYGALNREVLVGMFNEVQKLMTESYAQLGIDESYAYSLWRYCLAVMPSLFVIFALLYAYFGVGAYNMVRKIFGVPDCSWKLSASPVSGAVYILVFVSVLIFSSTTAEGIFLGLINVIVIMTPGMIVVGFPYYKSNLRRDDGRLNILLIIFTVGLFFFNIVSLLVMIGLFGASGVILDALAEKRRKDEGEGKDHRGDDDDNGDGSGGFFM